MDRGDITAVAIGFFLVILLTVAVALIAPPAGEPAPPATPATGVQPTLTTPGPAPAQSTPSVPPVTPRITARRISYTDDYALFPVRFLPADMGTYGSSSGGWPASGPVVFAYLDGNRGGITESFTVPYALWRMNATLASTKTPERARLRVILVDRESGLILEGAEIRYPGTVMRTVVAKDRPLYMVVAAENVEGFNITLEAPESYLR